MTFKYNLDEQGSLEFVLFINLSFSYIYIGIYVEKRKYNHHCCIVSVIKNKYIKNIILIYY